MMSASTQMRYNAAVNPVKLTVVGDELEAEELCGLLRTNGIRCAHRRTDASAAIGAVGLGLPIAGPIEVLVDEADLDAARTLLEQ